MLSLRQIVIKNRVNTYHPVKPWDCKLSPYKDSISFSAKNKQPLTLEVLKEQAEKGLYFTTSFEDKTDGTVTLFFPTPKGIKTFQQQGKQFSEYYYIHTQKNGDVNQTKNLSPVPAHDYEKLYCYGGKIYEFIVLDCLQEKSHQYIVQKLKDILAKENRRLSEIPKIHDVGAGHGLILKQLNESGFQGECIAFDPTENAFRAHLESKKRYSNYFDQKNNIDWSRFIYYHPDYSGGLPEVILIASCAGSPGFADDLTSYLRAAKMGTLILINLPVGKDMVSDVKDKLQFFEAFHFIEPVETTPYVHRQKMEGGDLTYEMRVYKAKHDLYLMDEDAYNKLWEKYKKTRKNHARRGYRRQSQKLLPTEKQTAKTFAKWAALRKFQQLFAR